MGDTTRGLYHKFDVIRTDGSSEAGRKHYRCDYFVLDLTHDPFASIALDAYQRACRDQYPLLAADLLAMILRHKATGPCGRRRRGAGNVPAHRKR